MRARYAPLFLVLVSTACSDGPSPVDAGTDSGGGALDAGTDGGGGGETDSGTDSGAPDGGAGCTEGCAYVELALGSEFSCARRENGEVRCWGRAENGELGDDLRAHRPGCPVAGEDDVDCAARPQLVALTEPATSIAASGGVSACALVGTGDVWCWGREGFRINNMPEADRFDPEPFGGFETITQLSDSFIFICGLAADRTPLCAGRNAYGEIGIGTTSEPITDPTQVLRRDEAAPDGPALPLTGVLEIRTATAFGEHACARTADTLYCWGDDLTGQLGVGDEPLPDCGSGTARGDCSLRAIPVTGIDAATITQLAIGQSHTCALIAGGTVMCWGDNRAGQLGDGTEIQRPVPTLVPGLDMVAEISAGALTTCARRTDGTVLCWGSNDEAQVGDGMIAHTDTCELGGRTIDCALTPSPVVGITGATELATGRNHSCVIRDSGEVWCWGANDKLQLGDGPTSLPGSDDRDPRYEPVMVEGL
jgi:alpha-tubulin suppressor-like RCC1 family protein